MVARCRRSPTLSHYEHACRTPRSSAPKWQTAAEVMIVAGRAQGRLGQHPHFQTRTRQTQEACLLVSPSRRWRFYRKYGFVDGEAFSDYQPSAFNRLLHLQFSVWGGCNSAQPKGKI